jgi:hypothetical protein
MREFGVARRGTRGIHGGRGHDDYRVDDITCAVDVSCGPSVDDHHNRGTGYGRITRLGGRVVPIARQ